MEYKCRNCGGELHFDPNLGKLKCDYCDSEYDVSEYSEIGEFIGQNEMDEQIVSGRADDGSTDSRKDLRAFVCPHCGAEVISDKDTAATTCIFCQTPMVMNDQLSGEFRPDMIVPFKIGPKQIGKLYEAYIASKPFYPKEYSKSKVIEKIRSIYLPFHLHNLQVEGDVTAKGEHTFSHTTSKWIITEHDVYEIYREGKMGFDKIPVSASANTPKNAMDSIEPYNYEEMVPFQTGFLPGFLAQRSGIRKEETRKGAVERAQNSFNNAMISTMNGFEGLQIKDGHMGYEAGNEQYVLMPAYLLFMDYDQHEDQLIAINGQTGKVVGNIPVDKKKRNRFFLVRFLLIWVLLFAVLIAAMMLID